MLSALDSYGNVPAGHAETMMGVVPVSEQVDKLLRQATDVENLCQHYIGWCSFW